MDDKAVPSKADIRDRLLKLASDMESIAVDMDYYGGFAYWATHTKELAGAAGITRDWVHEMDIDSDA